jgi:hypothetical protein
LELHLSVNLAMAIRAQELALLNFFADFLPTPCVTTSGDSKILMRRFDVVKLKRVDALVISAPTTPPTHMINRHLSYLLATPLDGFEKVRSAI